MGAGHWAAAAAGSDAPAVAEKNRSSPAAAKATRTGANFLGIVVIPSVRPAAKLTSGTPP